MDSETTKLLERFKDKKGTWDTATFAEHSLLFLLDIAGELTPDNILEEAKKLVAAKAKGTIAISMANALLKYPRTSQVTSIAAGHVSDKMQTDYSRFESIGW